MLENVRGALTSRGGGDFRAILSALADAGYVFGALMLDAAEFVPQSRPRLFVLAVADELEIPAGLLASGPSEPHHPAALVRALTDLPEKTAEAWRWWRISKSTRRNIDLVDILEDNPSGVRWRSAAETQRLVGLMSPTQQQKLADVQRLGARAVGAVYRRTRRDEAGKRVQRAEARFDGLAGCLRTPAGGSSRQTLLIVDGERIMSRLISPREAARLMGLPECYRLPKSATDAYHLIGDGVVAPVVRRLAEEFFAPILFANSRAARRRA